MKWLWGGLGTFACVVCGLLGLTAGINLNPQSTVKFVPDWGSLGDWVAGVAALLTFFVACIAMNAWRAQERQRLLLQWKADLVEYTNFLPYLKDTLSWPEDEKLVAQAAGKFYGCVKSYLLMIECVEPNRKEYYEAIWLEVCDAHNGYAVDGATRAETKEVFVKAYLNKFL